MKKLMIAAAIVCAAAMSQAAQFSWSAQDVCSGFTDPADNNAKGQAYLFLNTTGTAYDDVLAAVQAGTFLDKYADLTIGQADFNGAVENVLGKEGVDASVGQYLYAVFVADSVTEYGTGTDLGKVDPMMAYISGQTQITEVKALGPTMVDLGSMYGDSPVSENWYAQTVPEPTSGLLLLLGVAGLALRRRRA